MGGRASKDALFEAIALTGKAFASPVRLELLDLLERLARGDIVLIDVRPEPEYAAGHIEGARSIPLDEVERRLAELPADTEIVAYCRGPFCAYAHEAVRRLRAKGRDARRLHEGWPEWRLAASTSKPQRAA